MAIYGIAYDRTKSKKQSRFAHMVLSFSLTLLPRAKSNMVSNMLKNADINEHAITDPRCFVMINL